MFASSVGEGVVTSGRGELRAELAEWLPRLLLLLLLLLLLTCGGNGACPPGAMGVKWPNSAAGVDGIDTDNAEGVAGSGAPWNDPNPVEISKGLRRRDGGRFTFCRSGPAVVVGVIASAPWPNVTPGMGKGEDSAMPAVGPGLVGPCAEAAPRRLPRRRGGDIPPAAAAPSAVLLVFAPLWPCAELGLLLLALAGRSNSSLSLKHDVAFSHRVFFWAFIASILALCWS